MIRHFAVSAVAAGAMIIAGSLGAATAVAEPAGLPLEPAIIEPPIAADAGDVGIDLGSSTLIATLINTLSACNPPTCW